MISLDEFSLLIKTGKFDPALDFLINGAIDNQSLECRTVSEKVVEISIPNEDSRATAVDKSLFRALLARCCIRVQEATPQSFSGGLYGFESRVYLPFGGTKAADLTIKTSNTAGANNLFLESHENLK